VKVVVITGSSRGIGFGLSKAFLERDCAVVVGGSTNQSTLSAFNQLSGKFNPDRILGFPCDVRKFEQVQALWNGAVSRFGKVDIWINNAGLSGPTRKLWQQNPETAETVVETNLLGVIYGVQVAIQGMLEQGSGCIYNMEGMGSDGRMHDGLALYGMTKYGLKYLDDALVKETMGTPIVVGAIRPGMVVTDLILSQYRDHPTEWKRVKRIFNVIAERVEVVTPWLADQILANQKTGIRINFSSSWKLLYRFITLPFSKRDVFGDTDLTEVEDA